jgi:hypothetical protein
MSGTRTATVALEPPVSGVLVLGMHRSGTSVATRLVNLVGPSTSIDLLGPTTWNPRGIWESRSLIGFNDELLASTGHTWWYPPPDGGRYDTATAGLVAFTASARSAFDRVHPDAPWVWKDPRTSLVVPFWREVLGPVVGLLVYRHPLDVAMSLQRRNAMSPRFAVALWERYNRLILRHCQGMPMLVTSYDHLVTDVGPSLGLLREYLMLHDLADDREPDRAAAGAYVDRSLRHSAGSADGAADDPALDTALELHELLESLRGATDCFMTPDLAPEAPWVEAALKERGPMRPPEWRDPPG